MNKGLAKIILAALPLFVVAVALEGTTLDDLSYALYALVGVTWLIVGTWLSARIVMDKE